MKRFAIKWNALGSVVGLIASILLAPQAQAQPWTAAGEGWHPWYEVHVDPEDSRNILVCGSKWDFSRNALSGFIYRSGDGGHAWRQVLEDKSSDWVSEQSCAFGPHHVAYFLSEASLVRHGELNHHLGTSRLFVSTTAGEAWTDTLKMGWADWSTSAVNSSNGQLVTFYHYSGDSGGPENYGSTIGVLTFDPDGKRVSGPFLNAEMRRRNYQGVYPFAAVSLNDGTVGALYYGRRQTPGGAAFDLGFVRFSRANPEQTTLVQIADSERNGGCFSALGDVDLAYNRNQNMLAAVLLGVVDGNCGVILAESADRGNSWTKHVLMGGELTNEGFLRPSLDFGARGVLGLLWLTHAQTWRFLTFQSGSPIGQPVELWRGQLPTHASQDSMWTVIGDPVSLESGQKNAESSIDITVRSLVGRIWRSKGLVAAGDQFYAVGLGFGEQRQKLYAAVVGATPLGAYTAPKTTEDVDERDVTKQVRIVFGGSQSLDPATGALEIDLRLVNLGEAPIWTPIQLIAEEIGSRNGDVTVLNSDNGKSGAGAAWDLSSSITGDQIPARASMYNAFRLLFRLPISNPSLRTDRLLSIKVRVRARVRPENRFPSEEVRSSAEVGRITKGGRSGAPLGPGRPD